VLVGSDSRADVPGDQDTFGTVGDVPGQRADVIMVAYRSAAGAGIVSIPRDLMVDVPGGPQQRLAALLAEPQVLVDSLCGYLGIPTTHLVVLDMAGFASVVDALGGVYVSVDAPLRDPASGLDLPASGAQLLTGSQALALVRSRHASTLAGGTWVEVSEAEGAAQRERFAGEVLASLAHRAADVVRNPFAWAHKARHPLSATEAARSPLGAVDASRNPRAATEPARNPLSPGDAALTPLAAARLAAAVTEALAVSRDTNLFDVANLRSFDGAAIIELPVERAANAPLAVASSDTVATLATLGFAPGTTCHARE
jgi:LCP family protein required for cell wall assembly